MNKILGLYGQIGTGKSTVSEYLKRHNWDYINQDKLGHEVLNEYPKELAEHLGVDILDENGMIERPKFSSLVFGNPELLRLLVEFSYPIIINKTLNLIKNHNTVIEGAFFYKVRESIPHTGLVYVSVEKDILVQRLIQRGHDINWIYKVLDSQKDIYENSNLADFSLDNSEGLQELYKQIDFILMEML